MLINDYASKAKLSMAMLQPDKARRVANLIRGMNLEDAHRTLFLQTVKPARVILKLLKSAMANAEQTGVASMDRLFISEITVDNGPRIKRFLPRAQGRADQREKKMSHIQIKLSERKLPKVKKAKAEGDAGEETSSKKPSKKATAKKVTTKKGSGTK